MDSWQAGSRLTHASCLLILVTAGSAAIAREASGPGSDGKGTRRLVELLEQAQAGVRTAEARVREAEGRALQAETKAKELQRKVAELEQAAAAAQAVMQVIQLTAGGHGWGRMRRAWSCAVGRPSTARTLRDRHAQQIARDADHGLMHRWSSCMRN
jgi:hypothetical protein